MVKFTPIPPTAEEITRIEQDFQQAREFGAVRLGVRYLFYPVRLRMGYVALEDIEWIYGQREEYMIGTCCRRETMAQSFVKLLLKNGKQKRILFREDGDIPLLMAQLRQQAPTMRVGNVDAAGQEK